MFNEISAFSFPTRILFGCGAVQRLPSCLQETGMRKPFVVTDPGLRATPVVDAVVSVLSQADLPHEVFDRVHANPIEEDVLESAELYRSAGCSGVIGLGGGSALDVAKAVAVMARHRGALTELEAQAGGADRMAGPFDPIIAIPTTARTGSEVWGGSRVHDRAHGDNSRPAPPRNPPGKPRLALGEGLRRLLPPDQHPSLHARGSIEALGRELVTSALFAYAGE